MTPLASGGSVPAPVARAVEIAPIGEPQTVVLDREQFLMGTRLHLHVRGTDRERLQDACTAAFAEVARVESALSDWRPDSEVSRLNREGSAAPVPLSPTTVRVLQEAEALRRETDGAFDCTVGAVLDAVGLGPDRAAGLGTPSTTAEIGGTARHTAGEARLILDADAGTGYLRSLGTRVDLGGIGKGVALDHAAAVLRREGVTSALLNFGGEVFALGEAASGEPWEIEIAHPSDRDEPVARLWVRDAAVSTSGQSERWTEHDGRRFGHIVDPREARPVRAWGSVTVVHPSATRADGLSTALFVLGPEEAARQAPGLGCAVLAAVDTGPALDLRAAGGAAGLVAIEPSPGRVLTGAPGTDSRQQAQADPGAGRRSEALQSPGREAPSNEELARRIEILSRELDALRSAGAVEASAAGGAGGTPARTSGEPADGAIPGMPEAALAPAAAKVYGVRAGVSIGGYGEFLYENPDEERQDDAPSGRVNRVDALRAILYVGYKFSPKLLFNSELEFEHASTGKDGEVSVEFAAVEYLFDPRLNLRAGLLLVPLGLTNEWHEPPVFLGARRPDVERGILPTTWRANGAGIYGRTALGGNGENSGGAAWAPELRYRAYILESLDGAGLQADGFGASSGLRGGRMSGSQALAEDLAVAVRADIATGLGLTVGGSVFRGGTGQGARDSLGAEVDAPLTITEAHATFERAGWRVRALHARAELDDVPQLNGILGLSGSRSVGERMTGSYIEAGFDLLTLFGAAPDIACIPYARHEWIDTQAEVPQGFRADPANRLTILTVGAAFYPHPQVVLKADRQIRRNDAETGTDQWNLALGYLF